MSFSQSAVPMSFNSVGRPQTFSTVPTAGTIGMVSAAPVTSRPVGTMFAPTTVNSAGVGSVPDMSQTGSPVSVGSIGMRTVTPSVFVPTVPAGASVVRTLSPSRTSRPMTVGNVTRTVSPSVSMSPSRPVTVGNVGTVSVARTLSPSRPMTVGTVGTVGTLSPSVTVPTVPAGASVVRTLSPSRTSRPMTVGTTGTVGNVGTARTVGTVGVSSPRRPGTVTVTSVRSGSPSARDHRNKIKSFDVSIGANGVTVTVRTNNEEKVHTVRSGTTRFTHDGNRVVTSAVDKSPSVSSRFTMAGTRSSMTPSGARTLVVPKSKRTETTTVCVNGVCRQMKKRGCQC